MNNPNIPLLRIITFIWLTAIVTLPAQADNLDSWQLVGEEHFYLHSPPNSFTGLFRSQGIASDGAQWFFSWEYGLERTDLAFNSIQRNFSFVPPNSLTPGIPLELLALGLNHIGDIDYYNGILYVPVDASPNYTTGYVALYNASDLSYTGVAYRLFGAPSNPDNDIASWVAVDDKGEFGYGKEWQEGNSINVYRVSDWSFSHTITLDTNLKYIQGGKVWGNWLYMSSNNQTRSVYRANIKSGQVQELFQLPLPVGDIKVEGLVIQKVKGSPLNMYVEMVVDPNYSNLNLADTELNVTLFHYQLIDNNLQNLTTCTPQQNVVSQTCNYSLGNSNSIKP